MMWSEQKIAREQQRTDMCETVMLSRESYLGLLSVASRAFKLHRLRAAAQYYSDNPDNPITALAYIREALKETDHDAPPT